MSSSANTSLTQDTRFNLLICWTVSCSPAGVQLSPPPSPAATLTFKDPGLGKNTHDQCCRASPQHVICQSVKALFKERIISLGWLNWACNKSNSQTLNPISPPQPQRHGRASWPERESHFHYLPPPRLHIPPLHFIHFHSTMYQELHPALLHFISSAPRLIQTCQS